MCLRLYKRYHEAYCDTKQKIEDAEDETNLEASEMFVFGKFRTFKTRLSKVSLWLEYSSSYTIVKFIDKSPTLSYISLILVFSYVPQLYNVMQPQVMSKDIISVFLSLQLFLKGER